MTKLTLTSGPGTTAEIFSGPRVFKKMNDFFAGRLSGADQIFILVDENTRRCCLPVLANRVSLLQDSEIIEIQSGEANKSLVSAENLWKILQEKNASRHAILVNLGGGVISDLGGFVASTFKRGIRFINIPTTLIGMSDAAIGGKTGINLDNIKNQVGSFQNPEAVFIYPGFLKSLDTYHLLSGLAEIVKTALVADPVLWERLLAVSLHELMDIPFDEPLWEDLLGRSVENKCRIAEMDFRDRNIRGILNFGHTIGHAFESLSLSAKGTPLSHGHAIALGILCESRLSTKKTGLSAKDMEAISRLVLGEFEYIPLKGKDIAYMVSCMGHDKKMKGREIRMTLLEKPGKAVTGVKCDESEIREALDYYGSIKC